MCSILPNYIVCDWESTVLPVQLQMATAAAALLLHAGEGGMLALAVLMIQPLPPLPFPLPLPFPPHSSICAPLVLPGSSPPPSIP